MPAPNVDLVLVVDASDSMTPCFDQLKKHLSEVIKPLQGHTAKVSYGLVTQAVYPDGDRFVFSTRFVGEHEKHWVKALYSDQPSRTGFFSEDANALVRALDGITTKGDEDMLVALDIALDLPFGPLRDTKRVVAMFSDEPFEGNVTWPGSGHREEGVSQMIEKIHARRIKLFVAMPDSPLLVALAQADGSEVEIVPGGDGLAAVNFAKLLNQMGKSISASALQATTEGTYTRALFGQNKWVQTETPQHITGR